MLFLQLSSLFAEILRGFIEALEANERNLLEAYKNKMHYLKC